MSTFPIRSILVGSDLGNSSDEILRTAAAVAAFTGAKLHVVHAFDFSGGPYATTEIVQPVTVRTLVRDAELALSQRIRRMVPSRVTVASRRVVDLPPHRAIVERAVEVEADLIVLGPHSHRRVGDWFLGGTADRVVRTGNVPCLVVRRSLTLPLRRVVAPVDVSQPVRGALDAAIGWSAALATGPLVSATPETELKVLHVLPLDYTMTLPSLQHTIDQATRRVPNASMLDIRGAVLWGDAPAAEIVAFADRENADLLVLSTHGYGAAKRALLGSVSSAVASGAASSVLLVPPALWRVSPITENQTAFAGHAAE